MKWQLRAGTSNRKLGPTAYVVSLSSDTCPDDCPLKAAGCYAKAGHLRIHWARLDRGEASDIGFRWKGDGFTTLASTLRRQVPAGALLRIGDVGDPSRNGRVSLTLMHALGVLKRRGVRTIVYTHTKPESNAEAIRLAEVYGLALNFSHHGDLGPGAPGVERVTTVARDFWDSPEASETTLLRCPAETRDVTCAAC